MRTIEADVDVDEGSAVASSLITPPQFVEVAMLGEKPLSRTRLKVIKVRGGESLELVVRSRDVFCCQVHWLGKRSFVCPVDDCPACAQFVGSKWLGLLAIDVVMPGSGQKWLGVLELTAAAYESLCYYRYSLGRDDFFGIHLIASRKHRRGVLKFSLCEDGDDVDVARAVVSPEKVADAAATLFGLPALPEGMTIKRWEPRASEAARSLIGRAMIRNSHD